MKLIVRKLSKIIDKTCAPKFNNRIKGNADIQFTYLVKPSDIHNEIERLYCNIMGSEKNRYLTPKYRNLK